MILALVLVLALAGPAAAHGTLPGGTGFQAGALHPVVATEHLVALIAAGLAMGRGADRTVPAGVLSLFAGIAAGVVGLLPATEAPLVILISALAFGLLLASIVRIAGAYIVPLALILGWAVAADTDIPVSEGWAAVAGLVVAAGLIVLNMAALSQWAGGRWSVLPRIAGSWVFAIALLVLTLRLGLPQGPLASLP